VTVVAFASIKGSPGVTTAATAIAASWPAGRKVLLVEADPFGGDLAPRYGSTVTGGLASLFAAARRTLSPDAVWDHVHRLPGGLPVLFGLTGVRQAVANENVWPAIATALAGLDADVVVDAGRLLPQFGGGVGDVLKRADALVVLCEPTLAAIVHLRDALPGLSAEMRGRRLLVVLTGSVGYSAADIGKTLQIAVGPTMPDDPAAAAALANKRTVKKLERTRLLRWAAAVIAELGIEELASAGGGVTDVAEAPVVDQAPVVDEPSPADADARPQPTDSSPSEVEPVTVGSKWEARR
jgi:MinD-like ATPase involved in chromosome partitioning or flagellar assembly